MKNFSLKNKLLFLLSFCCRSETVFGRSKNKNKENQLNNSQSIVNDVQQNDAVGQSDFDAINKKKQDDTLKIQHMQEKLKDLMGKDVQISDTLEKKINTQIEKNIKNQSKAMSFQQKQILVGSIFNGVVLVTFTTMYFMMKSGKQDPNVNMDKNGKIFDIKNLPELINKEKLNRNDFFGDSQPVKEIKKNETLDDILNSGLQNFSSEDVSFVIKRLEEFRQINWDINVNEKDIPVVYPGDILRTISNEKNDLRANYNNNIEEIVKTLSNIGQKIHSKSYMNNKFGSIKNDKIDFTTLNDKIDFTTLIDSLKKAGLNIFEEKNGDYYFSKDFQKIMCIDSKKVQEARMNIHNDTITKEYQKKSLEGEYQEMVKNYVINPHDIIFSRVSSQENMKKEEDSNVSKSVHEILDLKKFTEFNAKDKEIITDNLKKYIFTQDQINILLKANEIDKKKDNALDGEKILSMVMNADIFNSKEDLLDVSPAYRILEYYNTKINGLIADINNNNFVNLVNNKFLDGSDSKGYYFTQKLSHLIRNADIINRVNAKYLQDFDVANKKYDQEEAQKILELENRAARDKEIQDQLLNKNVDGEEAVTIAHSKLEGKQALQQTSPQVPLSKIQEPAKDRVKEAAVEKTLDEVLNVDDITKLSSCFQKNDLDLNIIN